MIRDNLTDLTYLETTWQNNVFALKLRWNKPPSNQFHSPGHAPGCGIDDEVIDWMERIQNSATDDTNNNNSPTAPPPKQFPSHLKAPSFKVGHQHEQQPPSISSTSTSSSSPSVSSSLSAKHVNNISQSQPNTLLDDDFKYPYEKYTKEANVRSDDDDADGNNNGDGGDSISFNDPSDWHKWSHERVRRAATRKDDNRNTCSLFIQTDPLIWRHIREGVVDVSNMTTHCNCFTRQLPVTPTTVLRTLCF